MGTARERVGEAILRLRGPAAKVVRLLEDAEDDRLAFYAFPNDQAVIRLAGASSSNMQLGAIRGYSKAWPPAQPGVFDEVPERGSLPLELAALLAPALARHTTTPERCWFAAWEGFGDLGGDVQSAPKFEVPQRAYHSLSGPVSAAVESISHWPSGWRSPPPQQSPKLWWPDDHAWCVATEIDLDSTYIGCNESCRDDILALPEIEALTIDPVTGITNFDDLLNPLE